MTEISETPAEQPEDHTHIVARGGAYYRNMRFLMFALFVGMGIWFGYDGWVGWPRLNQKIADLTAERQAAVHAGDTTRMNLLRAELEQLNNGSPKTTWDLGLQKALGISLPIIGVFVLLRALSKSRGEIRLDQNVLEVPGHPDVPFENITEIDKRLWERKGIAYISYDLGAGQKGRLTLDDFVYEREPIDAIYARIDKFVTGAASTSAEDSPAADQTT